MSVRKLLNYNLLHELGQGGMASVWYAENSVGRPFAIKLLKPELVAQEASVVDRFRNEAQIMVKLDHPAVRRVEDYYEDGSTLAIIMEYLDGEDLHHHMKKTGRIPEQQALVWFKSILDAFNYVHMKGYFHRDVKPANLFISSAGQVKVMDFGIAKIVGNDLGLTQTNSMMGSPLYMSPEQILEPKDVDYRTDIYSLGVTLYTLLAGTKPYDDQQQSAFGIQSAIVQTSLPKLPHISATVNEAIAKATQKRPSDRFASCNEFAQALLVPSFVLEEATQLVHSNQKIDKPAYKAAPVTQASTQARKEPIKEPVAPVQVVSHAAKTIPKKLILGIVLAILVSAGGIFAAFFKTSSAIPSGKAAKENELLARQPAVPSEEITKRIALGITYYKKEQYDSAFAILTRYQGTPLFGADPEASTDLGVIYYFGGSENDHVQPDLKKAAEWLGKGADLGSAKAHYYLGLLTDGVDFKTVDQAQGKNHQAVDHYRKAAEGGDSYAQVTLAELYLRKNKFLQNDSPCSLLGYLDKAVLDPSNETAKTVRAAFQKKNLCL